MFHLEIIAVIMGAALSERVTAMTADPAYYSQPPPHVTSYNGQPLQRRPYPRRNDILGTLPLRQDSFSMRRQDNYPRSHQDNFPSRQQDNFPTNHQDNFLLRQQDNFPLGQQNNFPQGQQNNFPLGNQDNYGSRRPYMSTDLDRNGRQMRYRNNDIHDEDHDQSGYYPNRDQHRDDGNYYKLNERDSVNGYAPNYQDSRRSGNSPYPGIGASYPMDRTPSVGRSPASGYQDDHPLIMHMRR